MEALKQKRFHKPEELCEFVNDNNISIVSITDAGRKLLRYTLFYKDN